MILTHKNIKLVSILLGSSFAAYIIFSIITTIIREKHTLLTRTAILNSVPVEYLNLFNFQDSENVTNKYTELSSVRYPISNFNYEDKYFITVTKINMEKDIPLRRLIREVYHATNISDNVEYLGISQFKIYFYYLAAPVTASDLYFNLNGDSIKIIAKNDSIASYYLKAESFSVQYKKNGPNDLVGQAKRYRMPTCIMFYKKKRILYFILMSVIYDDLLKPDSLNNLMTK